MKTIFQKTPSDCGLACAAMALGVPYWDLHHMVPSGLYRQIRKQGCMGDDLGTVLQCFGCLDREDYNRIVPNPHWCSLVFMRNMLWGRQAIIQVRSKNNWDGFHYIFWDGNVVHDPSRKQRYVEFNEVEPMTTYLFHDNWVRFDVHQN